MRNLMGLKHAVGQLTESLVNDFSGTESETQNNLRQVRTHTLALMGTTALVLERRDQLLSTESHRRRGGRSGGSCRQPAVLLRRRRQRPARGGSVTLTPPCAYNLTVDQFTGGASGAGVAWRRLDAARWRRDRLDGPVGAAAHPAAARRARQGRARGRDTGRLFVMSSAAPVERTSAGAAASARR